ncbi:MAG: prolyl oligopeptidase family serine peptidase [Actinomycetota bacterium]
MSDPSMPRWERRFRAPTLSMPDWPTRAPDRIGYEGTESGIWQVHVWDPGAGLRRKVTDHPVGVVTASFDVDGAHILYWQDETGDESGRWFAQPFAGGDARPFLEGVPQGWNEGFAVAPGVTAASVSDRDGFAVYVALEGGEAKELYRSTEFVGVAGGDGFNRGGLSADGALLCLSHSEHGNLMHPALRVVDPRTGAVVAEQVDEGRSLDATAWSPIEGDQRLVVIHERGGEAAPAIWEPSSGGWRDLETGLEGPVLVLDWWPDASALLLRHEHEGRHRLYRFDLADDSRTPIEHPEGQVSGGRVRPDGRIWLRHASGTTAPRILDDTGVEVLTPEGERAPEGRPYVSWRFQNEHGQSVHGFYVTPEGEGPWPLLMHPHGGPTWLDEDRWSPGVQAYVDAGFAVCLVNYRGSTGFGAEWRDTLIGDIGGPEIEDLNAALADLVAKGVADPERAAIGGWSWGGYLTLMELGTHPELWLAGLAGVPVGDYVMSYDDMSPILQAYDRALLGGAPTEVPELMATRNPIVHADKVTAPVLFVIGENDSRCPLRQALAYVDALKARNHPHEVYLFPTGHGSFDIDEGVRQQRTILDFFARTVPGIDSDPA